MASSEMQLVCKIIKTGDLKKVIEWGITEEDFLTTEPKTIFKLLLSTYQNPDYAGSVIGPQMAAEKFTQLNFQEVDTSVTIDHLCIEVRARRMAKDIKEGAQKAIEEADTNPLAAIATMQITASNVQRLDAGKITDVAFYSGMNDMMTDYHRGKAGEIIGKFIWPWAPLQEATEGGQEDDYIVFYGRPKSMKSWVLCFLISQLVGYGSRVLVYTKEMTPKNIYKRIAACLARLPYDDLRHARLTEDQEEALMIWVDYAKKMADQLIVLSAKDVSGRDTVSWLKSKVEKYKPDVVFVDGLYLMSPDNPKLTKTNERVENISRAMRALILDTKTPVIATMQANRQAAKHENAEFDEIAFSDSLSQDCTMAIRVIKNKHEPTISLVFAGAREVKFAGLAIKAVPCTNFDYHTLLDDQAAAKAKSDDEADAAAANAKTKREPRTMAAAKLKDDIAKEQEKLYKKTLEQI